MSIVAFTGGNVKTWVSLPKKEQESETALGAESLRAPSIQILVVIQEPTALHAAPTAQTKLPLQKADSSWIQPLPDPLPGPLAPLTSPQSRHSLCLRIRNRMINADGGDTSKRVPETRGCYLTGRRAAQRCCAQTSKPRPSHTPRRRLGGPTGQEVRGSE